MKKISKHQQLLNEISALRSELRELKETVAKMPLGSTVIHQYPVQLFPPPQQIPAPWYGDPLPMPTPSQPVHWPIVTCKAG